MGPFGLTGPPGPLGENTFGPQGLPGPQGPDGRDGVKGSIADSLELEQMKTNNELIIGPLSSEKTVGGVLAMFYNVCLHY